MNVGEPCDLGYLFSLYWGPSGLVLDGSPLDLDAEDGMKKSFVLLPVLALAACMESTAPQPLSGSVANSAQLLNEKDEALTVLVNACNGEAVILSGTVHTKASFVLTPNGKFRASSSTSYNLSGVGTETGVTYHATEKFAERANVTSNGSVSSNEISLRMVGQGDVPNSVIRMVERTVVQDGDIKVSRSDVRTSCN